MAGPRYWARVAALAVVAPAAAFGSFTGLRGLAERCGWGDAAPLLPVALDGYAAYAWLLALWQVSPPTRRVARVHAWTAVAASAAGNAVERYMTADLLATWWPVVVLTGAAPALVFGAVCHLAARDQPQVSPEFGTALHSQGDAKLRENSRVGVSAARTATITPVGGGGGAADTTRKPAPPPPVRVNTVAPPRRRGTKRNEDEWADLVSLAWAVPEPRTDRRLMTLLGIGKRTIPELRTRMDDLAQRYPNRVNRAPDRVNGQQVLR